MGYFKKMKFDKQTIEFYNENAQKYSSYSYEHEKGDLYQKFLNNLPETRVNFGCRLWCRLGYKILFIKWIFCYCI